MQAKTPETPGSPIDNSIEARLRRIRVAIGLGTDLEVSKAYPLVDDGNGRVVFDISGGMTDDVLIVYAANAIHNLAAFRDNCIKFFRSQKIDVQHVWDAVKASQDLKLIIDLDNYNKHGELRQGDNGETGLHPRLRGILRAFQAKPTGTDVQTSIAFFSSGAVKAQGDASIVIFAEVVQPDGTVIGVLPMIQDGALQAWETLLRTHGFIN
jgi:hypothetical protein